MESTEFTKISVEVSGREKITVEFPTQDINADDMCQALRTIMIGMTFSDETVGNALASYLEEYYGDKYNVINIDE